MVDGWKLVRLGDYISLRGGLSYKSEFVGNGNALLVGMGCVSHTDRFLLDGAKRYGGDFSQTHRLIPGDIVIATRQQSDNLPILGYPAMVPASLEGQDIIAATNLYKVTNESEIDNRFLYWLLRSREYRTRILESSKGTTVRMLTKDSVEDFEFFCPPPQERKAIAAFLDALDDKIELNRRMNATLEAMARALFQSWFVDFDPVRAKLDGRPPTGLDPATAALFPNEFEDSQLGPIPKGWTIESVGDVIPCVGGSTPSTADPKFWEGGTHCWATPKDLSALQAPVLVDTERRITDDAVAKISSGLLPAGTLLLSSRAPVGYLAIATMPVAINQGFIAMKCSERASNYFMLNWCRSNMAEIESRASGTTFAEISKQNFRPITIILPPSEIMTAFTKTVAPLFERITLNVRQSRSLATLRDALLPRLLSGKIRTNGQSPSETGGRLESAR